MDLVSRESAGFALVDVLVALTMFGLGTAAIAGLAMNALAEGRQAALEGRRAALAVGVADRVRAGLVPGDSGIVHETVDGEAYEVEFVLRDSLAAGSLELSVRHSGAGGALRLGPGRILP